MMIRAMRCDPNQVTKGLVLMLLLSFAGACSPRNGDQTDPADDRSGGSVPGAELPAPREDVAEPPAGGEATAVLAGGCFWCVEAVFEQLEGVKDVVSGYAGGTADTADYRSVSSGRTGHAEAVKITYDPSKITYGELLRVFFATHDPTTLNRQGPDTGPQYRSAVFYADEQHRRIAQAYIDQLTEAGAFDRPIVTTLEPLTGFYQAEAYHQDYAAENPDQPYIRHHARPKVDKVRKQFGDRIKGAVDDAGQADGNVEEFRVVR